MKAAGPREERAGRYMRTRTSGDEEQIRVARFAVDRESEAPEHYLPYALHGTLENVG